jgi:hypothetical protein
MTISEQMTAAHQYAELWRALMPDVEQPGDDQFLLWAGCYSEKQISRGLSGAARKYRAMRNISQPMTAEDVGKYASSIMRHEVSGVRRFDR